MFDFSDWMGILSSLSVSLMRQEVFDGSLR